jgi:hypothetical protein
MLAFRDATGAGAAHNKLKSQQRLADCEVHTRDASRIPSGPELPGFFGEEELERSGDHGFFRSRQVTAGGCAHKIRLPIFALLNHDCTTDSQKH